MKKKEIKKVVQEGYAKIAVQGHSCYTPKHSCCGSTTSEKISKDIGYSDEDLKALPEGANLGLGCGNPVAVASLKKGETVLDLGSGAGIDCFLAAEKVGKNGKVIGVDMTHEMITRAEENAKKGNYENVEFRQGEIENLPVADDTVDVIVSNCVINLSPDKQRVFREAFRVLRPGGRVMVSDVVLLHELPGFIKDSVEAYIGCLSGALLKDDYMSAIKEAGFKEVAITDETAFPIECMANDQTAKALIENAGISSNKLQELAHSVVSIKVTGKKL
jgi:SAM-dependent methyltransferase